MFVRSSPDTNKRDRPSKHNRRKALRRYMVTNMVVTVPLTKQACSRCEHLIERHRPHGHVEANTLPSGTADVGQDPERCAPNLTRKQIPLPTAASSTTLREVPRDYARSSTVDQAGLPDETRRVLAVDLPADRVPVSGVGAPLLDPACWSWQGVQSERRMSLQLSMRVARTSKGDGHTENDTRLPAFFGRVGA